LTSDANLGSKITEPSQAVFQHKSNTWIQGRWQRSATWCTYTTLGIL